MTGFSAPDRPRRTVRQRLLRDTAIIGVMLLLAGDIVIWQVNRLTDAVGVLQVTSERATTALEVHHDSTDLIATVGRLVPVEDAIAFQTDVSAALNALQESHANLAALTAQATEDEAAYDLLNRVSSRVDDVIGIGETMVRQASAGQWPSVRVRVGILLRDHQQLEGETNRLVALAGEMEAAAIAQVASARRATVLYPALVMVLAMVLGAVLTWQTTRRIARPVERLTGGAMRLAAGFWGERVTVESEDELGQLATAFNQMADQLQASYAELEQRVAERTADLQRRAVQLQTAGETARDATAVLEPQDLMARVVALISERFGFYHAGIFLLDETKEWAVLQAASSEGGRRMLARGHRLKIGETGIVGHVTATGEPRIALDVGTDAAFFDNPDLPETRSELALPLRSRGKIIGALDVQSNKAGAFSDEDIAVLQTMADQVAVAIDNARLFEETKRLAQREQTVSQITSKLRSALDVETILQTAVQELGQALGASEAIISLGTERTLLSHRMEAEPGDGD